MTIQTKPKKLSERDIWKMNPRQLKAIMKKEGYTPMNASKRREYDKQFDSATSKVSFK